MDLIQPTVLHIDFLVVCVASVIMGSIVGLERELKHKPAGLKTHVMIAIGAAVFTFASNMFSEWGDPARVAAQVVSGIGFIGAGTIMQSKRAIQGLTTASTLWVVASIGMLNGMLLFGYAGLLTVTVLLFMIVSEWIASRKIRRQHYSTTIEITDLAALEIIEDMIRKFQLKITYKALVKDQDIRLKLNYATLPLTQHLFTKRLFSLDGVGEVVRI